MPKSYSNDISKPIFSMSHEKYVSFDNAKPLMRILDDEKVPVLAADYVIKTDVNIKSKMNWSEVKLLVARLDALYRGKHDIDEIFAIKQVKRSLSHKPDYIEIVLPNKDTIINGDTNGFLVLIAENEENVIMPEYYKFMMSKLPAAEDKGMFYKQQKCNN